MRLSGWLTMLTGMILFLTLIGVDTGLTFIVDFLGLDSTGIAFVDSSFFTQLIAAIAIVGTTGLVIGTFGRSLDPRLLIAPFIVIIAGMFAQTFIKIISLVGNEGQIWMTSIVVVLFGSLAVGFAMACLDYFSGG
jgi:hypothetical protein